MSQKNLPRSFRYYDPIVRISRNLLSTKVKHIIWSTLEDTRHYNDNIKYLGDEYKVPHFDEKGKVSKYLKTIDIIPVLEGSGKWLENDWFAIGLGVLGLAFGGSNPFTLAARLLRSYALGVHHLLLEEVEPVNDQKNVYGAVPPVGLEYAIPSLPP